MQLEDLKAEYDKLQIKYGAKELTSIYKNIMEKKPQEWDEKFADLVYENVEKHKYFITNLGKCT